MDFNVRQVECSELKGSQTAAKRWLFIVPEGAKFAFVKNNVDRLSTQHEMAEDFKTV